jgi:hypothetical protein
MSVQLRKLKLVSHSEMPSEQAEAPTVDDLVQPRKPPTFVNRQLSAGEAARRPGKNENTPGPPWSFIDEIESHVGLYTVAELGVVLQRPTCSIYRMAHRKQLPSLRVGGMPYFDPAALGMFFRKKSPESAAAARFSSKLLPARVAGVNRKNSESR